MTADGLRRLRVFFKFGLLVSLPVAGYLWAQTGVSAAALAMTAVCVVMALGAEGLASAAESRLARMRAFEARQDAVERASALARLLGEGERESAAERLRELGAAPRAKLLLMPSKSAWRAATNNCAFTVKLASV